jgi:hypothetical protein
MPDVTSSSAAAAVLLVLDFLTIARFPAFAGVPGVVGFSAVAFICAVAGILAVAGIPAVAVADPNFSMLLQLVSLCTVLYNGTYVLRTIELWLFNCHFFCYKTIGISNIIPANLRNCQTIGYLIKASIY